jgi:hypothetical protein
MKIRLKKTEIGEEIRFKGIWWLPDKPKKRILGTFTLIPGEGLMLELEGVFGNIQDILQKEIILGTSSQGEDITLYKCLCIRGHYAPVDFGHTSTFRIGTAFIGIHFRKPDKIKFKSISIHYSYLNEWFGVPIFDTKVFTNEVSIKCNLPKSVKIENLAGNNIYIIVKPNTLAVLQREASIKIRAYIKIEAPKPTSFKEYSKIIRQIQNFLSLAIMKPVKPLTIDGTVVIRRTEIQYPTIDILYQPKEIPMIPKVLPPFDMLFIYKDIQSDFKKFLTNWFEKSKSLELVFILYFSTIYNPKQYSEHLFLSLVYALESYHRTAFRNYELPNKEHIQRIKKILDSTSLKYQNWLEEKLKYSNEPSLRKRLTEIFNRYAEIITDYVKGKKGFIDKVVKTRNYLLHGDPNLKRNACKGKELAYITQFLKILLEISLLTEIGFSTQEMKNLISRNKRYRKIYMKDAGTVFDF